MDVREYLQGVNPEQYHIFDSHQEAMNERGVTHDDADYQVYSYDIHKNNKPRVGDVFLYRRPGKSSKTRKFYIYGGGVISKIVPTDDKGNVSAHIEKPFKLTEPLMQGESQRLEEFEWTSKAKEPGSWSHFWNQYGMNVIDEHDFYGLVGDLECSEPLEFNFWNPSPEEFSEENRAETDGMDCTGYRVTVYDDESARKMPLKIGKSTLTGRRIDWDVVENSKATLGLSGELLVMSYLEEQLDHTQYRIEHSSVWEGDGTGYDIKVTGKDGSVNYIEVKTTTMPYVDGFYISPRELNASRVLSAKPMSSYQIYRVYSFNSKQKTAKIKVFDAPFDDNYKFVPVGWKVHVK